MLVNWALMLSLENNLLMLVLKGRNSCRGVLMLPNFCWSWSSVCSSQGPPWPGRRCGWCPCPGCCIERWASWLWCGLGDVHHIHLLFSQEHLLLDQLEGVEVCLAPCLSQGGRGGGQGWSSSERSDIACTRCLTDRERLALRMQGGLICWFSEIAFDFQNFGDHLIIITQIYIFNKSVFFHIIICYYKCC